MTTSTPRQTYRDVLAQVVEQAKVLLPEQVNGRLESATKLVLNGDVFCKDDGSIAVGGSDPTRYYRLVGSACTCTDFVQEKAPQGWCKHKIAANLLKSVERVLARRGEPEPAPEVEMPAGFEVYPDNDPGPLEEPPPPAPTPAPTAPLPEAPVSITLKATLHGHEVLVTLRGVDFASVRAQVEEASAWLKAQAPAASPPAASAERRFCPLHGTEMQLNHKENRTWHSHRTAEGQWCKGK